MVSGGYDAVINVIITVNYGRLMLEAKNQFLTKIQVLPNGCWYWLGGKQGDGYGVIRVGKKCCLAHRVSMHLFNDFDLDSKLYVCHHCDNTTCVNPEHLYTGTQLDNMRDMYKRGRAKIGEHHPKNKLKESDVLWMREHWGKEWSCAKLAKKFGINPKCAWQIVVREIWTHI